MIAVIEHQAIGHHMARAMSEAIFGQFAPQGFDGRLVRNLPERNQMREFGQSRNARFQKGTAIVNFLGQRLVLRRQTMDGIGNARAFQFQTVIGPRFIGAGRQTEFEQRSKKQITGIITRERPSRAIGPVQTGGKADDQQPGIIIAKRGDGRIPPIGMLVAQRMAKADKARTARTFARRIISGWLHG